MDSVRIITGGDGTNDDDIRQRVVRNTCTDSKVARGGGGFCFRETLTTLRARERWG